MKKKILVGIGGIITVFFAGLGIIMSKNSIGFGELLRSTKELNPRVMSILVLPFIAVVFVAVTYLRKKSEERRWKNALLKTRAKNRGK